MKDYLSSSLDRDSNGGIPPRSPNGIPPSPNGEIPQNPPSYEHLAASNEIRPSSYRPLFEQKTRPPLSNSNSLSSILPKRKNVPYRPSKELQKHIDGLDSTPQLTTYSTGTRTEYFDVLPSFQMFQSILKRNDFEFDEDSLGQPPGYGDTSHSSPTPPSASPAGSGDADHVVQSVAERLGDYHLDNDGSDEDENGDGQYLFSDNEDEDGLHRTARPMERLARTASRNDSQSHSRSRSRNPNGPVTHESYGHSVLDNIDKLPRARTSPLDIQIFVTKDVPVPNTPHELETKLKEYSCGDIVNGYIIITNKLDKPVDFGLFTVSLEGTVKALFLSSKDPNAPNARKYHKALLKKFLKMYDLNASYNYGVIPNSAGIEYVPYSKDELDGCIMGLPNDRILEPNQRYKKFITFKFPEMLLDNACPHNVLRHTMPPPSFGIDGTAFFDRAALIDVNKALGYGVLNVRGTPVKVRDYAFEDISVSYAIEAKFIDKQHAAKQTAPIFTNDINDPENESKYIISRSAQFFLRFVPDIETQVDTYSRAYRDFHEETFETVGVDGILYLNLTKCSTWEFIRLMNLRIEQEIEAALDKREYNGDDLKRKNLVVRRDVSLGHDDIKRPSARDVADVCMDERLHYHDLKMIGNHEPVDVFGKKKKRLLLTTVKIGSLKMYVKVPDRLIQYGSPRLLQKYNSGLDTPHSSNALSPVNSRDGFTALQPVTSNMGELYNRDEDSVLKSVDIEISFDSLEPSIKPPSISLIEINVVAWSYRTEYPIPVSFEHDFFYTKPHDPTIIVQDDCVQNTKDNLQDLKGIVSHYIEFLKESRTYISQNTYSYLKGLSKLGVKKDTIKDYYQTVTSHTHPALLSDSNWEGSQLNDKQIRWVKRLAIPMKVLNKNSITLPPSFQNCLVGRLYALQIVLKYKGSEDDLNVVRVDVPVLVG